MADGSGRRPLIGITASVRGSRLMTAFNRLALWRAGARSVVLTAGREPDLDRLDGLLIGGGDDIEPELYGAELRLEVRIDRDRDALERSGLEHADRRNMPVLGICRGSQMLNIHRGGTLHADVHDRYDNVPKGRTPLAVRTIWIEEGTRLHNVMGAEEARVNVLHHQSVDHLGDGLRHAAHDRYGIVQAIEGTGGRYVVGVQWHPEFLPFRKGHQRLFRALAAAARGEHVIEAGEEIAD